MSNGKLQAAAELIREKRYREARALLKTVDHPKAREWITRIDAIHQTELPPLPPYPPPQHYPSHSFLLKKTKPKPKQGCVRQVANFLAASVIVFAVCAVVFLNMNPSSPRTSMTVEQAREHITNSLGMLAGGRNLDQVVYITDGRVIVVYRTTESTDAGYVEEWIDLFEAVAASDNGRFSIREVQLNMKTPLGLDALVVSTQYNPLNRYRQGQLSQGAFIQQLTVTPI